ncbi:Kinase, NEK [Giardia muris]|uniref:Kinase, NEK n=1 Tax=Giardia muris TaxID=5742 RepID=A0A4Z1T073_GIAMU|nr:Kinase, NEK [Giardia muris]|eukprot:TNJ29098.1 Kinase, NEK [Giardia muris]
MSAIQLPSPYVWKADVCQTTLGGVYTAVDTTHNVEVAIKVVCFRDFTEDEINCLLHETRMLIYLNHPNVLRSYDVIIDSAASTYYLIMEQCPGNLEMAITLHEAIGTPISEEYIWFIAAQMIKGLLYLHEPLEKQMVDYYGVQQPVGVVKHNYLTVSDVLIGADGLCKIGGICSEEAQLKFRSGRAPLEKLLQQAPEIVRFEPSITEKVDIWSLGMILYALAARRPLWSTTDYGSCLKEMEGGKQVRIPLEYSDGLDDFINTCLNPDAMYRPGAIDLQDHPIARSYIERLERGEFPSLLPLIGLGNSQDILEASLPSEMTRGSVIDPGTGPEMTSMSQIPDLIQAPVAIMSTPISIFFAEGPELPLQPLFIVEDEVKDEMCPEYPPISEPEVAPPHLAAAPLTVYYMEGPDLPLQPMFIVDEEPHPPLFTPRCSEDETYHVVLDQLPLLPLQPIFIVEDVTPMERGSTCGLQYPGGELIDSLQAPDMPDEMRFQPSVPPPVPFAHVDRDSTASLQSANDMFAAEKIVRVIAEASLAHSDEESGILSLQEDNMTLSSLTEFPQTTELELESQVASQMVDQTTLIAPQALEPEIVNEEAAPIQRSLSMPVRHLGDKPSQNGGHITMLMSAIERDDREAVAAYLSQCGAADLKGKTALMRAAERGYTHYFDMLISEARMVDVDGWTALFYATEKNVPEAIEKLAPLEADIVLPNGRSALMHAALWDRHECVLALAPYQAGRATKDTYFEGQGFTALMEAARWGRVRSVMILAPHEHMLLDAEDHDALWHARNSSSSVRDELREKCITILEQFLV